MTPEQQTSLNDALDAVTLARTNAERKASEYQADPQFERIASLCGVAQIEIRRALRQETRCFSADSITNPKAARAF